MKTTTVRTLIALIGLAMTFAVPAGRSQQSGIPNASVGGIVNPSAPPQPGSRLPPMNGGIGVVSTERRSSMLNAERQKEIIADTQKLLVLANELKADVDKSSKDTLSMDVIKKADEIERLAHSVKEKMRE